MKTPSQAMHAGESIRDKLLGAGLESMRKSYYPQLQTQIKQLRENEKVLLKTVDDLEQAGREITKREARFRALNDTAPVIIILLDCDGNVLEFNREAERVYGFTRQQVLGHHFKFLLNQGERDAFNIECQRILSGQTARGFENAVKTAVGEERVFVWNADRLVDERSQIIGVVAVGLEITARKRAEKEVLRLNQELEERVALRTRELEISNSELDAFTSMVSHDLRGPLRRIRSYMQFLQESSASSLNEESQGYMNRILDGAAGMQSLINSLLNFSRAARVELSRTTLNLEKMVGEVQQELQSENTNRKIVWETQHLPVLQADRALLRQVFINLLSNGLKYSAPRPESRIQISSHETDSEHVISICDNGVGFDPRQADRLFKPFQRLHSEQEFSGNGIGLATVARIIKRHGGRVWAQGASGQGACFHFTIPKGEKAQG